MTDIKLNNYKAVRVVQGENNTTVHLMAKGIGTREVMLKLSGIPACDIDLKPGYHYDIVIMKREIGTH